ncbi:MAG: response regulator [FCB group bacterium]|nr:response regulator [FCB group bacterium]
MGDYFLSRVAFGKRFAMHMDMDQFDERIIGSDNVPRNKPRLLIIDDDTDFISDLSIMLSTEFEIFSAATTPEACDRWMECRPNCVLLDLQLPEYFGDNPNTEGIAFLSHMKSDPPRPPIVNTPVVVISAHADENTDRMVSSLGVKNIYRKPPDLGQLKETIRKLIFGNTGYPS